ncbi:AI-2E family transporter, partial [Rhizobium ruizarguesonis]
AQRLPGYISQLQQFITQAQNSLLPDWFENQMGTIKDNLSCILSEGMGFLTGLFAQIWNSGKAIVDVIALLVVTPVVAFYIL